MQYVLWTMTDILKTQNPLTDKRSFVDAPYIVWLTAAETQVFSWWKTSNGRVKLKTVVTVAIYFSFNQSGGIGFIGAMKSAIIQSSNQTRTFNLV